MEHELSGSVGAVEFSMNASVRVKSALSIYHYNAAKLFAEMASSLEGSERDLPYPQPGLNKLKSFSIAAVVQSVAAAESKINEMYLHVVDQTLPPMKHVSPERMEVIKEVWGDIEKLKMLRKYQLFLTACESPSFDISQEPYQSMALLVTLRNSLVHYKPQWDDEEKEHAKLESKLSNKFSKNALFESATGSKAWFPHLCLGQGCANWSVSTTKDFLACFYSKLEMVDNQFV